MSVLECGLLVLEIEFKKKIDPLIDLVNHWGFKFKNLIVKNIFLK